jgi:hypothetical protein
MKLQQTLKQNDKSSKINIDVKARAKFHKAIYGLEREETNFLTKFKYTFDELATIIDIPNVFEFRKQEMMNKIQDYKKEPDLVVDFLAKTKE